MAHARKTIRELREAQQWSQRRLSVLLDVTQAAVQAWEMNRAEPKIAQMRKIMDVFGVSWDDVNWPDKSKKLTPAA